MYWLRISCAICVQMASVSPTSSGKKARPPVASLMSTSARLALFLVLRFSSLPRKADGIDHGVRTLGLFHDVFQGVAARVVLAVGDDQQHFLIPRAFFQMVERANHGVIERGAAAGVDAFEGVLHFVDVAGEIVVGVEIIVVVEIDDEGFVLRIAGFTKRQRGGVHLRALVAHAAAVVDHQAHADGHVFLF